MKELTHEDWMKNPTPREMWVWDDYSEGKLKRKVVYYNCNKECTYPVICLSEREIMTNVYQHCAEIEEQRHMTNYEVAKWLYDGTSCGEFREYRYKNGSTVYHEYTYDIRSENEPCDDNVLIRSNGGEWREPLKESE